MANTTLQEVLARIQPSEIPAIAVQAWLERFDIHNEEYADLAERFQASTNWDRRWETLYVEETMRCNGRIHWVSSEPTLMWVGGRWLSTHREYWLGDKEPVVLTAYLDGSVVINNGLVTPATSTACSTPSCSRCAGPGAQANARSAGCGTAGSGLTA